MAQLVSHTNATLELGKWNGNSICIGTGLTKHKHLHHSRIGGEDGYLKVDGARPGSKATICSTSRVTRNVLMRGYPSW